jgi:hypothetical protein
MSASPVVNSLRRKRAEISGMVRDLERRAVALRRDLAHIDAALKIFAPGIDADAIKALRPRRPKNRLFGYKELSIRVMNALREAPEGGVTAETVAARIVADKGLEPLAEPTIGRMVAAMLPVMRRRGIAVKTGEREAARWALRG